MLLLNDGREVELYPPDNIGNGGELDEGADVRVSGIESDDSEIDSVADSVATVVVGVIPTSIDGTPDTGKVGVGTADSRVEESRVTLEAG